MNSAKSNNISLKYHSCLNNQIYGLAKELSFYHKLKFSNLFIFVTWWREPYIFQTEIIRSDRIHSLKYLRSMSMGCKDIRIRKSEIVAKTQFLWVCGKDSIPWSLWQRLNSFEFVAKTQFLYVCGKDSIPLSLWQRLNFFMFVVMNWFS